MVWLVISTILRGQWEMLFWLVSLYSSNSYYTVCKQWVKIVFLLVVNLYQIGQLSNMFLRVFIWWLDLRAFCNTCNALLKGNLYSAYPEKILASFVHHSLSLSKWKLNTFSNACGLSQTWQRTFVTKAQLTLWTPRLCSKHYLVIKQISHLTVMHVIMYLTLAHSIPQDPFLKWTSETPSPTLS